MLIKCRRFLFLSVALCSLSFEVLLEDGFADDAMAFAAQHAEFFQAERGGRHVRCQAARRYFELGGEEHPLEILERKKGYREEKERSRERLQKERQFGGVSHCFTFFAAFRSFFRNRSEAFKLGGLDGAAPTLCERLPVAPGGLLGLAWH